MYILSIFSNLWVLSVLIAFLGGAIFILYLFLRGMKLRNNKPDDEATKTEE